MTIWVYLCKVIHTSILPMSTHTMKPQDKPRRLFVAADGKNYLWPFVLVTTLFFLWGFAHSILDVLNKHFQDSIHISKTESALIQAVVYGGYFLMALPAGAIIRRHGYRAGVLTGLLLYGTGALLFIPGSRILSFPFFLFSLFVIGCGLTCLETAANPYVTELGNKQDAERRINLSQSFNGLGWVCGPLVGGWFLFAQQGSADIATPYAAVGVVVLLVALVFSRVRLPEISGTECASQGDGSTANDTAPLWKNGLFRLGLSALFLYVAAQTGINSFFINYATEHASIGNAEAAQLLSFGGMGLFMLGRMGGSWMMARIRAVDVLLYCSLGAALALCVPLTGAGTAGIIAFMVCYLCESIMFPTIFALALRSADRQTKKASSLLIMCIVGGAVAPLLMGLIADRTDMATAFVVPLACFVFIGLYALRLRTA